MTDQNAEVSKQADGLLIISMARRSFSSGLGARNYASGIAIANWVTIVKNSMFVAASL
jgi:hypothetical protein